MGRVGSGPRRHHAAVPVAALAAVVAAALALRVAWVLAAARPPVGPYDPSWYLLLAGTVADGDGYGYGPGEPSAYYPPGYPLVLAAVVRLWRALPLPGEVVVWAGLANAALGAATVGLIGVLGRRAGGARLGLVAAALAAVLPTLVLYTGVLLSETLAVALLAGALVVLTGGSRGGRRLVAAGVLLGAAALVRPVALPLLPLVAVVGWPGEPRGRGLRHLGLLVAGTAAVLVPWTARNAVTMGAPVVLSTNTGDNLCIGNHPGATGAFALPDWCFEGWRDGERPAFEVERDRALTRQAVGWALDHPGEQVRLVGRRLWWTFHHDHGAVNAAESFGRDPFLDPGARQLLHGLADAGTLAVLALAVPGSLLLATGGGAAGRWVLLAAAATLVPVLVTFGDTRFKLPAVALLTVAAARGAMAVGAAGSALAGAAAARLRGQAERRRAATPSSSTRRTRVMSAVR